MWSLRNDFQPCRSSGFFCWNWSIRHLCLIIALMLEKIQSAAFKCRFAETHEGPALKCEKSLLLISLWIFSLRWLFGIMWPTSPTISTYVSLDVDHVYACAGTWKVDSPHWFDRWGEMKRVFSIMWEEFGWLLCLGYEAEATLVAGCDILIFNNFPLWNK